MWTLLFASASAPSYCLPVALRDYEVLVGRVAVVRVVPGCQKPARLRKVSQLTGRVGPEIKVPVGKVMNIQLFASRLDYTLDGKTWKTLSWSRP